MSVKESILNRRSVRDFEERTVPTEMLLELIEAARWAPSAVNRQPCRYVVVEDPKTKAMIAKHARLLFVTQKHVKNASSIIVVSIPRKENRWYPFDAGAAIQNMLLRAQELGLATCWIGAFSRNAVGKAVSLPSDYHPVALVAVGYASRVPPPPERASLGNLAFKDRWGNNLIAPEGGRAGIMSLVHRRGVSQARHRSVLIAADGILYDEKNQKLALIRRKGETYHSYWALPGGMLETWERIEETLSREMKEELGVDVDVLEILGVYSGPDRDPRGPSVSVVFVCGWSGQLRAADDAETVGLFTLDEALQLEKLAFDHKIILEDFREYLREHRSFWSTKVR